MKKSNMGMLAGTALILTGCVVTSVYPFYTEKDVVFESGLLGQWHQADEKNIHWKFDKEGTTAYRLTYTAKEGETNVVQAHLFKLGDQRFLDLFAPQQDTPGMPPPIPAHFLLRVFQLEPTVRMAAMNHDWLRRTLEKDPKAIRHQVIKTGDGADDRRAVLAGDTAELQQFLLKHLKTEDAWKDSFELKRDEAETKSASQATR